MMRCLVLLCATEGLAIAAGEAGGWQLGGGRWQVSASLRVLHQSEASAEAAAAWLSVPGQGGCWRAVVEPGPFAGTAGLRWGAAADGSGGVVAELVGTEGGDLVLADAAGKELWRDQGVGWCAYTPVWLEGIAEADRVRLQMLAADAQTLLAQSPWFSRDVLARQPDGPALVLTTAGNTARFCLAERSAAPLAEFSPDNPSVLRVPRAGEDTWAMIGGGAWRWQDRSRRVLLSTRPVERTTAFLTAPAPAEGTWRCRIRLNHGTCGGGMLIHADKELQNGFLAWLGGTYGNGCFMLYRYPIQALWAGPQGVWKWDTEYLLEVTLREGTLRARMLAGDGATVLAESPALPISAEDARRTGMTGFQTWHGTGAFSGFMGEDTGAVAAPAAVPADLGHGWRVDSGRWSWAEVPGRTLVCQDREGTASVRCEAIQGSRGTFRCRVKPAGAKAVSLLFQFSLDGAAGFECRLGSDGLAMRSSAGQTLWQAAEPRVSTAPEVFLEGMVTTDRVKVRVVGSDGKILAESVERYVSDTNNTRVGLLGLRCEDGPAEFSDWSWTAE
jgi:hypothetical protein